MVNKYTAAYLGGVLLPPAAVSVLAGGVVTVSVAGGGVGPAGGMVVSGIVVVAVSVMVSSV